MWRRIVFRMTKFSVLRYLQLKTIKHDSDLFRWGGAGDQMDVESVKV